MIYTYLYLYFANTCPYPKETHPLSMECNSPQTLLQCFSRTEFRFQQDRWWGGSIVTIRPFWTILISWGIYLKITQKAFSVHLFKKNKQKPLSGTESCSTWSFRLKFWNRLYPVLPSEACGYLSSTPPTNQKIGSQNKGSLRPAALRWFFSWPLPTSYLFLALDLGGAQS